MKWVDAVPVIEIITPALGLQTLFLATQHYAMALGLTRLVFFRELVFFLIRTPIILWAAFNHGVIGVAYAMAGTGIFHALLNLTLYKKASGKNFIDPIWAARRSLVASILMAGALAGLDGLMSHQVAALLSLGAKLIVGVSVFTSVTLGLWRLEGRPDGVEATFLVLLRRLLAGRLRQS